MSTLRINFQEIASQIDHTFSFDRDSDNGNTEGLSFIYDSQATQIPNDNSTYARSEVGVPVQEINDIIIAYPSDFPEFLSRLYLANGFVRNFQQNFAPENLSISRNGFIVTIRDTNNAETFSSLATSFVNEYTVSSGGIGGNVGQLRIISFENTLRLLSQTATQDTESTSPCLEANTELQFNIFIDAYRVQGGTSFTDIVNTRVVDLNGLTAFNRGSENNRITFRYFRGTSLEVTSGLQTLEQDFTIQFPDILLSENITINTNVDQAGLGTATIVVSNIRFLELEYSLDDVTFQTSNFLTNLIAGDYTVYVRDQLGCTVEKTFTIAETGISIPIAEYPQDNSILFVRRKEENICEKPLLIQDVRSCDSPYTTLNYRGVQIYQYCDSPSLELHSNHNINTVEVFDLDNNLIDTLATNQVSINPSNIGNREGYQVRLTKVDNGIALSFFNGGLFVNEDGSLGDVYPYRVNDIPAYLVVDSQINIDGFGFVRILNRTVQYQTGTIVLFLDIDPDLFTETVTQTTAYTIFNIQNYEVFHIEIDFSNYTNHEFICLKSTSSDDSFDNDIIFDSEIIQLQENHEDSILIEYWNNQNTDTFGILYEEYGLRNLIRAKVDNIRFDDIEFDTTDQNNQSRSGRISNVIRDSAGVVFTANTYKIQRHARLSFNHHNVLVNNVEVSQPLKDEWDQLETSNMYIMTVVVTIAEGLSTLNRTDGITQNPIFLTQGNGEEINLIGGNGEDINPIGY